MTTNVKLRNLIKLPPDLIDALGEVSARYGQIEHLLTKTIKRTRELSYDDAFAEVKRLGSSKCPQDLGRKDIRKKAKQFFDDLAKKPFGEINGKDRKM